MKVRLAAAFAICITASAAAQAPKQSPPSREAILTASRSLIEKAQFSTFVTLGENGEPRARIVDPFSPDSSFVVWIGTKPLTRKVGDIKRDARVVLVWFDPQSGYVSLSGRAEAVSDPAEKQKHWKEGWAGFYPGGSRSDEFMLIRVRPVHLEIVGNGMAPDPKTWKPVMLDFPQP